MFYSEVVIAVIVSCVFSSYFCLMESQEIISLLLSQLGQSTIIFTSEGLKWRGISLLPGISIFFPNKKEIPFHDKEKTKEKLFQKELSNAYSRRTSKFSIFFLVS